MADGTHGNKLGLLASFKCAGSGIAFAAKSRNFKIEIVFGLVALILCWVLPVSSAELLIVVVFIALVLGAECANTALEALVDIVSPNYSELAKHAKDCSAGAVLLLSIGSLVAACIIFIPKFLALLG